MQAILTKYFPVTNTKPARIKAECARGSMFVSVHSNKMIESIPAQDVSNHRVAATELINKFVREDNARYGTNKNPWTKPFSSGQLPSGDYAHVFIS